MGGCGAGLRLSCSPDLAAGQHMQELAGPVAEAAWWCCSSADGPRILWPLGEMAMAARCPSATGVQTPSRPSPSRRRPTPSPIQRPHHHLRPLPRNSAARALQPPPKAEERSSLPRAFPVPANQQADPPPTPPSFTTVGMPAPPLPRLDLAGAGAVASSP